MEKPLKLNKIIYALWGFCLASCQLRKDETSISNDQLLKKIDKGIIALVAPASWVDDEESKTIAVRYPTLWDRVSYQYNEKYEYLANTDKERFKYFKDAIDSETFSAIWALRGGYGSARIIPLLVTVTKPSRQKWLIGYSDITALHLFVSQVWGWKSIHGPVAKEIIDTKKDPQNLKYLDKILSNVSHEITYNGLKLLKGKTSKTITGKLTGGNTALISSSIGTPWQIDTKGKIVIIEESGHGDRIDRIFQHLKQSKILEEAAAIIIGDIIVWDTDATLIINDFIKDLTVPVFKTDIFGHGAKNYPWIYNAHSIIESDDFGSYQLTFQTQ